MLCSTHTMLVDACIRFCERSSEAKGAGLQLCAAAVHHAGPFHGYTDTAKPPMPVLWIKPQRL